MANITLQFTEIHSLGTVNVIIAALHTPILTNKIQNKTAPVAQ